MRILIADKLPDTARTRLQEAGLEVVFAPDLNGDALSAALSEHDPDVLVVRSTEVRSEQLEAARGLQLVVRAGAGVNTIDLLTASARGVFVANCPGTNSVAVAELALGHVLNADRRIADAVADLRAGRWRKKEYSRAGGLKGRVLGVIGCGSIGAEVIRRARAFDMAVVAWSPSLDDARAEELGVRRGASVVDVARQAHALTVHVALSPATRGLIGEAVFDALPRGAIFVNTSRGEVVDEAALARAVRDKGIRAGLDVFEGEPAGDGEWRNELVGLPGVYGTHHVGASTAQAQDAVADMACAIILRFARTGSADSCVNIAEKTPATHLLVLRHRDEVGVLARVLDALQRAEINVQRMENMIFSGEEGAACARIQVEGAPSDELLGMLRGDEATFDLQVVPLG